MARIDPIPIDQAEGKARELLDELVQRGGEPGPMVRAMANAPALLRGYLDLYAGHEARPHRPSHRRADQSGGARVAELRLLPSVPHPSGPAARRARQRDRVGAPGHVE